MKKETIFPKSIKSGMIAPCGMNCSLCLAYLREKNRCFGCNGDDKDKPYYCVRCKIKNCEIIVSSRQKYCFKCKKFPCTRLKQLDKRYRSKYSMSMIENLENIRESGIRQFIKAERKKWTCPGCGGIICVHRENCVFCGEGKKK